MTSCSDAPTHPQQEQRLLALYSYEILDTDREKDFDDIVQLAAAICEMPIGLVSLVDAERQWFKASVGFDMPETPLSMSICSHAILEEGFLEIGDTTSDPRSAANPLVCGDPEVRFYAGALLTTPNGFPIGTLCVLDHKPRDLTPLQRDTLKILARQVMVQLEMRRSLGKAEMLRQEVDHRVKNSLQSLSALARLQMRQLKSAEAIDAMSVFQGRLEAVSALHKQLYVSGSGMTVDLGAYLRGLCTHIAETLPPEVTLTVEPVEVEVVTRQAVAVGTMLNEFVANSLKHAFPDGRGAIRIECEKRPEGQVYIRFSDDGIGMPDAPTPDSQGIGLKVIEAACVELDCDIHPEVSARGVVRSITFKPERFASPREFLVS